MLKISKFADYATVALAEMAHNPRRTFSAARIAAVLGTGLPTAAKLLKILAIENLVVFHEGPGGGYALARPAKSISLAEIIDAGELQPLGMTDCSGAEGPCAREAGCRVRANWRRVNAAVRALLEDVKLSDMIEPAAPARPRSRARSATIGLAAIGGRRNSPASNETPQTGESLREVFAL